eukprot:scaffold1128_cov348-Pavlova_lutheri.AAC.1
MAFGPSPSPVLRLFHRPLCRMVPSSSPPSPSSSSSSIYGPSHRHTRLLHARVRWSVAPTTASIFDGLCGQGVRTADFPPKPRFVAYGLFATTPLREEQREKTAAIAAKIQWKSFQPLLTVRGGVPR